MTQLQLKSKKTIDLFFKKLSEIGYENFEKLIKEFSIDAKILAPFAQWSDKKYQRVCLAHDAKSELILLCWAKGQGTPVHSHNKQECWVHIVEGEMQETLFETYSAKKVIESHVIANGAFTYLTDDIAFHQLENINNGITMTLHLYANPITECDVFDKNKNQFISVKMKYDNLFEN